MEKSTEDYQSKRNFDIEYTNKIELQKLAGIHIDSFRKFSDQSLDLGSYITVIAGKNGTMKSSLMGLCIHIFESEETDIYKNTLNTKLSDVFKLSLEKDTERYAYDIKVIDVNDHKIKQPARIYPGIEKDGIKTRHRVTLSASNQRGDTRFNLPVSYLNLKRLFPQVLMEKIKDTDQPTNLSQKDLDFISDFFEKTLYRTDFNNPTPFASSLNESKLVKNSFGPSKNSVYDSDSISSGEDNLGIIASQLLSLHKIFSDNQATNNTNSLTGILAIDEYEATLHASTTFALFDYLYNWARQNHTQIILTTHSTVLLEYIYQNYQSKLDNEQINVNVIKSLYSNDSFLIQKNPPFSEIQEEITLKKDQPTPLRKINVLLEDKMATMALKKLVKKKYLDCIQMDYNVNNEDSDGTDYIMLSKLAKNYPALLENYHAFVVLDGEADFKKLKLTETKNCIQFPSIFRNEEENGFPFEKEIVHFALTQPADSILFSKHLQYSKEAFISKTVKNGIRSDLEEARSPKIKIEKYKNFFESNKQDFWKIVTFYKKSNQEIIESFNQSIEDLIQCSYKDLGINYPFRKI